jgi:hydroxymethylbilane synthase
VTNLTLGTRGSDLALAQTRLVAAALGACHPALTIESRIIRTTGDVRLDVSLSNPGPLDKGLFTKELEDALLRGEIHAAVHSLKDLPTDQPDGLTLGAILDRADPVDVLISKAPGGLAALPAGAIVATSSLRRRRQLLHLRPDLAVIEIRGNVPTRLRKLAEDPAMHGLILAKAGLDRLGAGAIPHGLDVVRLDEMLPAPGQGAIAVECRAGDSATLDLLRPLHHEPTARCVAAERDLLRSLGGGCHLPLGAHATIDENGALDLRAALFHEDRVEWLSTEVTSDQ